jgi:pyruvate-ferredoxin/flavodoxin oxidoreductase
VPIRNINAFGVANPLHGLGENGSLFIQSRFGTDAEVWAHIPAAAREIILNKRLRLFYLDAVKIARELAATPDLQLRMQGIVLLGIFLRVAPFVRAQGLGDAQLFER